IQDGCGDEDHNDDEDDEGEDSETGAARRVPPWLKEIFICKVAEANIHNADGIPCLYESGSFWFPTVLTFFLLRRGRPLPEKLYSPRLFLWDPQSLVEGGIGCPLCGRKLSRNGHVPYPRRVVDLDQSFWIIRYQYRCPSCITSKSGKSGNRVFRSWDKRIIARLPLDLQHEFPARLSWWSGISHSAFSLMRSCFQNGMGAKQFSDALRVQHVRRHDLLHLMYLAYIQSQRDRLSFHGCLFPSFPPFDDHSPDGYCGYVPSSQWLRDMYDDFISEHEDQLNQHTSMLTGQVCAIDHSHKITKHIFKLNGVEIYCGLLTVTNEKGEIRVCNLVPTKSHSQFELALVRMRESLELYGHSQPLLFYTDNMADKQFLEASFPSLRRDVIPVEKHAHLEPLQIPNDVQIYVRATAATIDAAVLSIIDRIPEDGYLTVGFDTEWNVDLANPDAGRSPPAIIQIAVGNQIHIFQVGPMLASGGLPMQLRTFLANPRVRKAGHMVDVDLEYLQKASGSSQKFVGGLDLAQFAKQRNIIRDACLGLSDLCAIVLKQRLNKNVPARVS
ncbi:hypothetical protein OE88DRAFT_1594242, partial [Heliocybe sulcata]